MRVFFENSYILAEKVKNALEGNDINCAVSLLEDSQNYAAVKTGASELVPIISKYICSQYESENSALFNGCVNLLGKVVEIALVDDILVQLLEILERSDSTNFSLILNNAVKVLLRTQKESKYLGWCTNSIQVRLNKCEIPNYGVNSIKSDNDVFYIEILYQDVLRFYDLIMPSYLEQPNSNEECKKIFIKYLIQLLAKPMGYLDLGPHEPKSRLRRMAEDIVKKVISICNDPYKYMGMDEKATGNPTIFAYGMFLHFLLDENINYRLAPKVYTNVYIFRSSLIYITKLLKSHSNQVILKGLCTIEMVLKRTSELPYQILDIEANKDLCQVMEKIIVFNQHQEIRLRALDVFNLYLQKLEPNGQYLLLTNLVIKMEHSGLSGYMITQYKEILYASQQNQSLARIYFEGENLYKFVKKCYGTINLDGIFQYDKVISLLNLMRFAVVQVTTDDCHKFKSIASTWREEFFNQLEAYLENLKRVTKQKIFNVENDNEEQGLEFDLTSEVAAELDSLNKSEKLESLNSSLLEIEMTESVLQRVIELLEEKKLLT